MKTPLNICEKKALNAKSIFKTIFVVVTFDFCLYLQEQSFDHVDPNVPSKGAGNWWEVQQKSKD